MSKRHKETNTYRFASFSERIAALRIDKSRQLVPLASEIGESESDTHFNIGLAKWGDLNSSVQYYEFRREVATKALTLPMLLVNREAVLDSLEKHMLIKETAALPALADLVARVACDLQQHFYPRFAGFLQSVYVPLVIDAVSRQDTEVLDALFASLTALFKVLARFVAAQSEPERDRKGAKSAEEQKEIEALFSHVRPLVEHTRAFVREFAAQSFAYLVRKLSQTARSAFMAFVLSELSESQAAGDDDPNEQDEEESEVPFVAGCGELLFALLAGVRRQLQPFWRSVFTALLGQLTSRVARIGRVEQRVLCAYNCMFSRLFDFISKEYAADLVTALFRFALRATGHGSDEGDADADLKEQVQYSAPLLGVAIGFLTQLVEYRDAVLLAGPRGKSQLLERLSKLLSCTAHSDVTNLRSELRCIVQLSIICSDEPDASCIAAAQKHLDTAVRRVVRCLDEYDAQSASSLLCELAQSQLVSSLELFECSVLPTLVELLYRLPSDACPGAVFDETMRAVVQYAQEHGAERDTLNSLGANHRALPSALLSVLERFSQPEQLSDDLQTFARLWAALSVLQRLACATESRKRAASLAGLLLSVRTQLIQALGRTTCESTANRRAFILCTVSSLTQDSTLRSLDDWLALLDKHATDALVLRCIAEQFERTQPVDDASAFRLLFPRLRSSLTSQRCVVRCWSLRTLNAARSTPTDDEHDVLQLALHIESIPLTVQTQRDWLNAIAKLERASQHPCDSRDADVLYIRELPLLYALGVLRMNFTPLWQPCQRLLAAQFSRVGPDAFWKVLTDILRRVALECSRMQLPLTLNADVDMQSSDEQNKTEVTHAEQEDDTLVGVFEAARLAANTNENTDDRPNSWRYRECLLKTLMLLDPSAVEPHAGFLVDLLLTFVREELNAPSNRRPPTLTRAMLRTTLIVHLELFTRVRVRDEAIAAPLRGLVLHLLTTNETSIQAAALGCQLAFAHAEFASDRCGPSPLSTHRESLERLLDDRRMAHELVSFSIEEQHRAHIMPVLVRLLYGRLRAKSRQARNQKRSSASVDGLGREQLAILRFLAKHCRTTELDLVLHLVSGSVSSSLVALNFGEPSVVCSCPAKSHADAAVLRRRQAQLKLLLRLLAVSWHAFNFTQLRAVLHAALDCIRLARCALDCAAASDVTDSTPAKPQPSRFAHLRNVAKRVHVMSLSVLLTFCTNVAKANTNARAIDLDETLDLPSSSPIMSPADVANVLDSHAIDQIRLLVLIPNVGQLARDSIHKPSVLLRLVVAIVRNATLFESLAVSRVALVSASVTRDAYLLEHLVECLQRLGESSVISARNTRLFLAEALCEVLDACFIDAPSDSAASRMQAECDVANARLLRSLFVPTVAPLLTYLQRLDERAARTRLFEVDLGLLTRLVRFLLPDSVSTPSISAAPTAESVQQIASIADLLVRALGKLPPSRVGLVLEPLREVVTFLSAPTVSATSVGMLAPLVRPLIALLGRVTGVHAAAAQDAANEYTAVSSCRAVRTGLCQLITAVCGSLVTDCGSSCSLRSQLGTLAADMNAFDARFIEQPDFDRRFDAFERALKLLQSPFDSAASDSDDQWTECALLTANNCLWHLDAVDRQVEGTLKQSCGFTLLQVINVIHSRIQLLEASGPPGAPRARALYRTLIVDLIAAHMKRTLRRLATNSTANARDCATRDIIFIEYVAVLRALLDAFGDRLPFGDLLPLRNTQEPDFDFFDNIRHIQLARRTRAVRTLIKLLKNSSAQPECTRTTTAQHADEQDVVLTSTACLRASTLRCLVWPVLVYFLNDTRFEKKAPTLIQSCLEAVMLVSARLSWPHYSTTLRSLVEALLRSAEPATQEPAHGRARRAATTPTSGTSSKLLVKTVAAVIDGFHFEGDVLESAKNDKDKDKDDAQSDTGARTDTAVAKPGAVHSTLTNWFIPRLLSALEKRAETLAGTNEAQSAAPQRGGRKRKSSEGLSATRATPSTDGIELATLCVPFAKLITRLPPAETFSHWRSLVLRVASWLKSRERELRDAARNALSDSLLVLAEACSRRSSTNQSAALGSSLGDYVRVTLEELRSQLATGFQRHVLCRVALVLVKRLVEKRTVVLDLDSCAPALTDLFNAELFGELSEQKAVAAVVSRTPEAKTVRGFEAYELTLQHVGERGVLSALHKLDMLLAGASQFQLVSRLSRLLDRIASALLRNARLTDDVLVRIVASWLQSPGTPNVDVGTGEQNHVEHGADADAVLHKDSDAQHQVVSEQQFVKGSLVANSAAVEPDAPSATQLKLRSRPLYVARDCRLVDTEPARYGHSRAKLTRDARTAVRLEFGLSLLLGVLKKSKREALPTSANDEDDEGTLVLTSAVTNTRASNLERTQAQVTTLERRGIVEWLIAHVAGAGNADDAPATAAGRKEQTVRVKVLNMTLRCITQLISSAHTAKVPLLVLSTRIDALVGGSLALLRKYVSSATELHRELVAGIFKLLRLLARRKLAHCFDQEQLRVLVGYADQLLIKAQTNMYDHAHAQLCTCAFAILNLVAKRRAHRACDAAAVTAINELFDRVKQLSLAHADEHVRGQARNCIVRYVNEAGLKRKQFTGLLEYFSMQLLDDADHSLVVRAQDTESENGDFEELDSELREASHAETVRASALEMLNLLVGSAAARSAKLNEALSAAFVPLCAAFGNSHGAQLQRLSSAVLRTLLTNVAPAAREQLWLVAAQWLASERLQLQRLALLVLTCFIQAEQRQFAISSPTRLETVLERVAAMLRHYTSSDDADGETTQADQSGPEIKTDADRMLHTLLTVVELLTTECDVLKSRSVRVRATLTDLFQSVLKRCLLHAHAWVRLVATRIFSQLLRTFTSDDLVRAALLGDCQESSQRRPAGLLRMIDANFMRWLVDTSFKQLRSVLANDALCEQVIGNLSVLAGVVVARCMAEPKTQQIDEEQTDAESKESRDDVLLLSSFARRINTAANFELVRYQQSTLRRSHLFRLIAAVFAHAERVQKALDEAPLIMSDQLASILISPLLRATAASRQAATEDREVGTEDPSAKLVDLANEVLDVVKRFTGVERFAKLCAGVETRLRTRRVARKRSLAQLAVTNPEVFARVKVRRNAKKRRRFSSKLKK